MPSNLSARSAGLGGSSIADPEGAAALQEGLGGLALGPGQLWARYQSLAGDVPNVGAGALTLQWPIAAGLEVGLLWQHLFDSVLARDRLRVALGVDLGRWAGLSGLSLGLGLDRLHQDYSLDPAYTYYGLPSRDAQAFDAVAGLLWRPLSWASLGVEADQLTSPNLGVVGSDIFLPVLTWGAGVHIPLAGGRFYLQGGQVWDDMGPTNQAGGEWRSSQGAVALRLGSDGRRVSAGAGFKTGSWRLDYVYRFGLGYEASVFGGDQGVDLGLEFGGAVPTLSPTAAVSLSPTPVYFTPTPTAQPTPDTVSTSVARASVLWDQGHRAEAVSAINRVLRGRRDLAVAQALRRAWVQALVTPTAQPTPNAVAEVGLKEAQIYSLQGRDDLARAALQAVLKKDPRQAQVRAAIEALGHVRKVSVTQRARSKQIYRQGVRRYAAGDKAGAVLDWQRALRMDPENVSALSSLTRVRAEEQPAP